MTLESSRDGLARQSDQAIGTCRVSRESVRRTSSAAGSTITGGERVVELSGGHDLFISNPR